MVTGLALGVLVILLIELVGQSIFPLPMGMDTNDPQALRDATAAASPLAWLFVALAWGAGAFVGAWITARITGEGGGAVGVVTVVLLVTSVYNMAVLPNPLWFWVLGVAALLLGAWWGSKVGGGQAQRA